MNTMDMMMNAKRAWDTFTTNHPKFPMFLNSVKNKGITEDTIIEIKIKSPDGTVTETNLKVKASDIELFDMMRNMR